MHARRPTLDSVDRLFRTAFDEAPIGMCLIAPDGSFLQVNSALCRMLDYAPEELLQRRVPDITHPEDRDRQRALLDEVVKGTRQRYEVRRTKLRRDGTPVPVLVNVTGVRTEAGELEYIVAQLQDLTHQTAAERALRDQEEAYLRVLEQQARHDTVTGLPNRRELGDRLQIALDRAGNGRGGAALIFCDLDNFKAVNDAHGHGLGDDLLVAVGNRLKAASRGGETVCRFGGDEFVMLGEEVGSLEDAVAMARRFVAVFARPFAIAAREFQLTVSAGVAFAPSGTRESADAFTRNADIAMYRAKALGRNKVVAFSDSLRQELLERMTLERELRAAVSSGGILCHYQPIIELGSRRISRVEALARWRHPERGMVPPETFVSLASRSGLMGSLGEQVLTRAAAQAAEWSRGGRCVDVAVNVDSQQLSSMLPRVVSRALEAHALAPGRLCLELTESALLDAQGSNAAVLRDLAAMGVKLAVDDFGTGYSSFAYLRDLPVHEVKLDRSFITRITTDERDLRVVAGMIRLAHELGMRVVAEGVETRGQLDALIHLGCDDAQGFLFAGPVPDPFAQSFTGGWPA